MSLRRRGFTLVEILVTLAIVVILVGLITYACFKLFGMVDSLKKKNAERVMIAAATRLVC